MYLHLGRAEPAPRASGETTGPITPLALTRVLDTTSAPFRCICRIHVSIGNRGHSFGTGVLISRHHVLTCAHVLYPRDDPHSLRVVSVLPGQNGADDKRPPIPVDAWAVNPRWRWNDCRAADADLAILRLARPVTVGFWPLVPFEPALLTGSPAHLAGYPVRRTDNKAQVMYRSGGRIIGRIRIDACTEPTPQSKGVLMRTLFPNIGDTTGLIAHGLDSGKSMSGGPIWQFKDGKRVLIAVHAGDIDNGARKKAILLNSAVRTLIADWIKALPPRHS